MFDDLINLKKYTDIKLSFGVLYKLYAKFMRKILLKKIEKRIMNNPLNYSFLHEFIIFYHNTVLETLYCYDNNKDCACAYKFSNGVCWTITDCHTDTLVSGNSNSILIDICSKEYTTKCRIYFEITDECKVKAKYTHTTEQSLLDQTEDPTEVLTKIDLLKYVICKYIENYMYSNNDKN